MVVPAASVLALAGEIRRRRERLDTGLPAQGVAASPAKALALGVLVTGAVSSMGLGERVLADPSSQRRVLRVNPELLRPLGHAAAMAALTAATRLFFEKVFGHIEKRESSVEAAFDVPPPNPLVSGSLDSHVEFATLARQGRRFVWMVSSAEKIDDVTGEAASPRRSGSTSGSRAPTPRKHASRSCSTSSSGRVRSNARGSSSHRRPVPATSTTPR